MPPDGLRQVQVRAEQKRKGRPAKNKHIVSIKEIKLRPGIEEHDFLVKANSVARFLKEGDKVKATIMFRGREIVHPRLGQNILDRLAEHVKEFSTVERHAKLEGKNMIMILAPKQEIKQESKQQ